MDLTVPLGVLLIAATALAQKPVVQSISVGPVQQVLAPDHSGVINGYGGLKATSDEHATILPPGTLQNSDYLFWVSTTAAASDLGAVVLSGGSGPDANGQWTLNYAAGYGSYASGSGAVFLPPVGGKCPAAPGNDATNQDTTFDLSYAGPGTVIADPTNKPGSVLMLYEATNVCSGIGTAFNPSGGNAYITIAVATSADYGHSWPTYRGTPSFPFTPLPNTTKSNGPNGGMGVFGSSVCMGNDCSTTPPAAYGRYAVVGPVSSLSSVIAAGKQLGGDFGMSEPSAFLDDAASTNANPYVYTISAYKTDGIDPALPSGRASDLVIARAQLNGGTAPLAFSKWNGHGYTSPGIGGADVPFLPDGAYTACGAANQARHDGAISYVDETQQYLLMFTCWSPTDPFSGSGSGAAKGAAWFWATAPSLDDPTKWSAPAEIAGTWTTFDTSGGCPSFPGWYAGWMSLGKRAGHLGKNGYVFFLDGCEAAGTPGGRKYSSRSFTIATSGDKRRSAEHR